VGLRPAASGLHDNIHLHGLQMVDERKNVTASTAVHARPGPSLGGIRRVPIGAQGRRELAAVDDPQQHYPGVDLDNNSGRHLGRPSAFTAS
jgi:hypothetical protein